MNTILLGIGLILLLCCAAFFSGAETAITAISRTEYRSLKKINSNPEQRLARLIEIKDKIVTTTLIGTNFVNVLNSGLTTAFTISVFGHYAVPITTICTAILIIIVAEIFPKALAAEQPLTAGKIISLPLYMCYLFLRPITMLFSLLSKAILAGISTVAQKNTPVLNKKDLQLIAYIGKKDGILAADEAVLLERALLLQHLKIRSIMSPRTGIIALTSTDSFETIVTQFRKSRFSRLPVYSSSKNTILGILHYKDIVFQMHKKIHPPLSKLMRPAVFVPETCSVFSAMKTMNVHSQNMLIVVTELGNIAGLITIDDVTAAVFSNNQDSYNYLQKNPMNKVLLQKNKCLCLPGNIPLEQCNELLHTQFHSDYYDTLGGFLLEHCGYLPHTPFSIECPPVQFTVTKIADRHIKDVMVDISNLFATDKDII